MARRMIRCQAAPGFDGCFRAGRKWPASGIEVEITSDQDDVEAKDGQPLKIGQKTFTALQGDTRFSFGIAGTLEESDAIKAQLTEVQAMMEGADKAFEELRQELRRAHDRIRELEAGNLSLKDEASKLVEENAALKAKLAEATAPKAEPVTSDDASKAKGKGGK
jgi:hypothetical protein